MRKRGNREMAWLVLALWLLILLGVTGQLGDLATGLWQVLTSVLS